MLTLFSVAVYINLLGLVLIVIVGLAITKPLNTGSFVVSRVSRVMSGILVDASMWCLCSLPSFTMDLVFQMMVMVSFSLSSNPNSR